MTWEQVAAIRSAKNVALALGYPEEDVIGCAVEPSTREVLVTVRGSDGEPLTMVHDEWEVTG